jgi:hypothetical protein
LPDQQFVLEATKAGSCIIGRLRFMMARREHFHYRGSPIALGLHEKLPAVKRAKRFPITNAE